MVIAFKFCNTIYFWFISLSHVNWFLFIFIFVIDGDDDDDVDGGGPSSARMGTSTSRGASNVVNLEDIDENDVY